jgi:fatty-acid desaturase
MNTAANATAAQPLKYERDWFILGWMVFIHIMAIAAIPFFSWQNVAAFMVVNFIANCLGITLCYHRLLTHRSFKVNKFWERVLATCGILALQGSPLEWVSHHRMHHAGSDTPKDPHNANRGFWFSHIGWLFWIVPEFDDRDLQRRYARDIGRDPYMRWLESVTAQIGWQVALGTLLWVIGGFGMMMWGVFFRLAFCYHCTWLVNSAAHFWGSQRYKDVGDRSRNNWWVALLTWGEGWHNNHHRHEQLAPAGHRWYEIDITMGVIRIMQFLGIATHVKDEIPSVTVADNIEFPNAPAEAAAGR